ncbi:MAG: YkvA family protein [Oceanicoccus sp.]
MSESSGFEKEYSEKSFWDKLAKYAKAAGVEVVEKALLLYFAAQEENTPAWAKAVIVGALGYFISPIDAVPDLTPLIGYTDDLGVLVMAIATISAYVNQNVKDKTQQKMTGWFGESRSSESSEGAP